MMERWCQYLLPAIKSCVCPYVSLAMQQYHLAQFNKIQTWHDLFEVLQLMPSKKELTCYEVVYKECMCPLVWLITFKAHEFSTDPHSILQPPKRTKKALTGLMQNLVAAYLTTVFDIHISTAKQILPGTFTAWGKVQITNSGDCLRVQSTQRDHSRDASLVHVHKI